MDLSATVIGSTAAKQIRETQNGAVLKIGKDRFTRGQLAGVECYNFTAASNLSRILNAELKVSDVRDVYQTVTPAQLALPRLGAIALAVLGAAFEAKGLGGTNPLESWVRKHQEDVTTFLNTKHRVAAEQEAARKGIKQMKQARRNKAHGLRVARFERKQISA